MAYDSVRHVVVLFGGEGPLGDTWEWDGNSWTQIAVTGPSARDESAMVLTAHGALWCFSVAAIITTQRRWGRLGHTCRRRVGASCQQPWPGSHHRPESAEFATPWFTTASEAKPCFSEVSRERPWGLFVAQADTWEWDGTGWSLRATTGPAARTNSRHGLR